MLCRAKKHVREETRAKKHEQRNKVVTLNMWASPFSSVLRELRPEVLNFPFMIRVKGPRTELRKDKGKGKGACCGQLSAIKLRFPLSELLVISNLLSFLSAMSGAEGSVAGVVQQVGLGGVAGEGGTPPAAETAKEKTLVDIAKDVKLKEEYLDLLLNELGLEKDEPLDVVALAPSQGADELIGKMKKDGDPVSLGEQGRMRAFLRRVRETDAKKTEVPDEKEKKPDEPAEEVPLVKPPAGDKRKKSDVLDQMDDGLYEQLDPDAKRQMRSRHREVTGGNPMALSRPTTQQLAALKSRLEAGDAPYTDFAVFGPYGNRLSKIRKFEAQVFVDGELKTRILRGPSNFESWSACWSVFRAAMIMLDKASPQVLDDYHEGIRQLSSLFPSAWGIVFTADEIMRSEQWDIIQETLVDDGADDQTYPWNKVIAASAFGRSSGDIRHWWDTHVVFPVQSSGAGGARVKVAEIEGSENLPTEDGRFGWVPGKNRGGGGSRRSKPKSGARPSGGGPCVAWNNGGCVKFGKCPMGDKHSCSVCGGSHPAVRCWQAAGKGKGKNAEKGKSSGKGKKGKDKSPSK